MCYSIRSAPAEMPSAITPSTAVLAVIDWQERLFPAMDEARREGKYAAWKRAVAAAQAF